MTDPSTIKNDRSCTAARFLPPLLLVIMLLITTFVWWSWHRSNQQKEQARFNTQTKNITHEITTRLDQYKMILWGGTGLFTASDIISRDEWRAYVEQMQIPTHLSGVQGLGYSEVIQPAGLTEHIQRIRAEGFPSYTVWPQGKRDIFVPIIFIEPFDARNQRAFGYDIFSESVRRAAMERARDTGKAAMTEKVRLHQETEMDGQPGFILYVPLYLKDKPLTSLEERQAALMGFISAPFRMNDFVHGIFPVDRGGKEVHFSIYDGNTSSPPALMYDSKEASPSPAERHKPMFTQQETIDLYGHQWTMTFATLPAFERSVDRFTSAGIFVSGILISLLVFSIVSQQEKNRQRARALAREMTVELLESKKQADTLARKNELILNSAGEGIFGVDIKGGCIFVNPAAAEMLGFKVEELIGQRIHNIIHQRPAHTSCEKSEECPIHLTLRDGLAHHKNEDIFWRKDGTPFPVEYSSTPIWDESDQLSGTVVTFNDITEHLRAEKDRIIRQVAEQANKAKSAFIAHMSHEIRTPMNAVLGCTQILLGEQPSFSSRHVDLLQTIQRSGGHLLSLINDILDISKIEAGHVSRKETVFSLPNLLQEIQAVFRLSAENKGLRFFVYYDETLPPYVQADEGRLRQVLVNLLGNAIKFTEQGSVVLRAHADIIQNKTAEEPEILHLLFEVEDTGPGILQEDLGKIFIPFEQTSSGIRGDGTGLGLSISSKLVQLMGGRLTVESTPGQGSRFRFYIRTQKSEISPKLERVETRQIIGLETLRGSGGETLPILVVDDSETNRIYLHRILEMNGFKVVEASNGQEAIESFEHYSPQAVFMDIQMPVMDGLEASRRIKATDKGRNVPIIAITGYADEEYEQRGFMAGIDAYLGKPFIVEELFKVLGKCLHLSYKYQENNSRHSLRAPSLTAQDLATLPQELRAALRQSVEEGDISRLRELIARIKEHDVNTAQGLQALADEYEYDKIDALFEQEEN